MNDYPSSPSEYEVTDITEDFEESPSPEAITCARCGIPRSSSMVEVKDIDTCPSCGFKRSCRE